MRLLVVLVLLLLVGCISEETKQLAQGAQLYQVRQAAIVERLADYAKERGALTAAEHKKVVEGQQALGGSLRSLSEILGAPKTPVEVDSW